MNPEVTQSTNPEAFLRQHLLQRQLPNTLEELATQEGILVQNLPTQLSTYTQHMVEFVADNLGTLGDELKPDIDFVYRLWYVSRNIPEDHPLYVFTRTLDSFKTFTENYLSHTSALVQVNLAKRIDSFVYMTMQKQRHLDVVTPALWRYDSFGVYNTQDEWVRIPKVLRSDHREEYVTRQILEEVITLRGKLPEDLLYHSTGSAALPGIGKYKALLSSSEVSNAKEPLVVGEVYEEQGRRRTLNHVYTALSPKRGYATARWFDEFYITFGVSVNAQQAYLQEKYPEVVLDEYELADLGNDGVKLGPRVPLQNVCVIYTDFIHKPTVEAWVQEHCPHAQVISYEAYEVIKREKKSYEYGDPPQTAEELFQQPSILVL